MIAQVTIDAEGCVYACVDTDQDDLDRLAGLVLDNMLEQAKRTALDAWREIHCESESAGEPSDMLDER